MLSLPFRPIHIRRKLGWTTKRTPTPKASSTAHYYYFVPSLKRKFVIVHHVYVYEWPWTSNNSTISICKNIIAEQIAVRLQANTRVCKNLVTSEKLLESLKCIVFRYDSIWKSNSFFKRESSTNCNTFAWNWIISENCRTTSTRFFLVFVFLSMDSKSHLMSSTIANRNKYTPIRYFIVVRATENVTTVVM